ncbi:MAG: hypothetical protein ACON4A_04505 [Flavobacteriaceae bacterium]
MNLLKSISFLGLALLFFSCSKAQEEISDEFECTVDYIEFIDNSNAIVKFDTTNERLKRSFYGRYTYVKEGGNYYMGDKKVTILNFKQEGDKATFNFIYGENLGPFCANLFEILPDHDHVNFGAEAVKVKSGKSVGRWKIKKKSTLNTNQN